MYSKEKAFDPMASTPSSPSSNGGPDVAAGDVERLARELRADGERIVHGMKQAALVEWKRLNLRAVDAGFRVSRYVMAAALALTLAITATVLLVTGIRGALLAAIGNPWVADLATGILVLAATAGACFAFRARVRAHVLASTKRAINAMHDPVANGTSAAATAKAGSR